MASGGTRKGEHLFLAALVAGQDGRSAAKVAGIGERTARRLLADPAFRRKLSAHRDELVDQAAGRLSTAVQQAIAELCRLMSHKSAQIRLGACRCVLEHGLKYTELVGVVWRVANLEGGDPQAGESSEKPADSGE